MTTTANNFGRKRMLNGSILLANIKLRPELHSRQLPFGNCGNARMATTLLSGGVAGNHSSRKQQFKNMKMKVSKSICFKWAALMICLGIGCTDVPLSNNKQILDDRIIGFWKESEKIIYEIYRKPNNTAGFRKHTFDETEKTFKSNEDSISDVFFTTLTYNGVTGNFISVSEDSGISGTWYETYKYKFTTNSELKLFKLSDKFLGKHFGQNIEDFSLWGNKVLIESQEKFKSIVNATLDFIDVYESPINLRKLPRLPQSTTNPPCSLGESRYSTCPPGPQYYNPDLLGLWESKKHNLMTQFYLDKELGKIRSIWYTREDSISNYQFVMDFPLNVAFMQSGYYFIETMGDNGFYKPQYYEITKKSGYYDKLKLVEVPIDYSSFENTQEVRKLLTTYVNANHDYLTGVFNSNSLTFHRVDKESIESKNDEKLALALILLIGTAILSGDSDDRPTSNNTGWDQEYKRNLSGYDSWGMPIYGPSTRERAFDEFGNKINN